jgi:hypothetical protein
MYHRVLNLWVSELHVEFFPFMSECSMLVRFEAEAKQFDQISCELG